MILGNVIKKILFGGDPSLSKKKAGGATLGAISGHGVFSTQADIAVVIPTVARESLLRAARSVFAQDCRNTIHLLIGVDIDRHSQAAALRTQIYAECPENCQITWLDPGFSTSKRNGGVHSCHFGGAMRTILSFLANAPVVAYLDDDDWYGPDHLREILDAIDGKQWAYTLSYYADGDSGKALCVDEIESVGVGSGIYQERFGGFVRPSALAINKLELASVLHFWSASIGPHGDGEDRLVFEALISKPHGQTGKPTVYCPIDPRDQMHSVRSTFIASRGMGLAPGSKNDSVR